VPRNYSYDHKPQQLLADLALSDCPCCGGTARREIGTDNGFRVEKCLAADCGMVYVNPRPTLEGLAVFYRTYFSINSETSQSWAEENELIIEGICDWIMEGRSTPGDLLDVGCAFGHQLEMASKRGWRTMGIEPSPTAAAIARKIARGPVQRCGIEEADLQPMSFDAVVSVYVLEHVAYPLEMMRRIFNVLRPGGQAIIRVPYTEPLMPAFRVLGRPLMHAPMHLNDFSPNLMRRIGRSVGFLRVEIEAGPLRRSKDPIERLGVLFLGNTAIILQKMSGGRILSPLAGGFCYRFWKGQTLGCLAQLEQIPFEFTHNPRCLK
jgi:SAM-dependent methyltransferase